jgi:hypothetical protein
MQLSAKTESWFIFGRQCAGKRLPPIVKKGRRMLMNFPQIMSYVRDFFNLIFDIGPILRLPPLVASAIFGVLMGILTGLAAIGVSVDSSPSRRKRVSRLLWKGFLYGLALLQLIQWLFKFVLHKLTKGGLGYFFFSLVIWFGVLLLFHFPAIRRRLMKVDPVLHMNSLKMRRNPVFKEVVNYCRSHPVKSVACCRDGIHCFDFVDPAACVEEFIPIYDGIGDDAGVPVPSPALKVFHFQQLGFHDMGQQECAAFALALAARLGKYDSVMHVVTQEDYTYQPGTTTAIKSYMTVNGNLIDVGGRTIGGRTVRSEALLSCFYYVAPSTEVKMARRTKPMSCEQTPKTKMKNW